MTKIVASVEGMMCKNCEKHMCEAVKENFKVKKVTASHDDNLLEIIAKDDISEETLRTVVEETGYKMTSYSSEEI